MAELAHDVAQCLDIGAAAAKFHRHAGLDQAGCFQFGIILGDEKIALIGQCRAGGEAGAKFPGEGHEILGD